MSSNLSLARPYARAAFELAQSGNALGEWARKLAFAAEIAADRRVQTLLGDPRVGAAELASLFLPTDEMAGSPFATFIGVLADNRRLETLPDVAALFEQLKSEAERTIKVRVRTATPIGDAETAKLKDALKRRFGREIEIEQSIDPSVIGGAVIDAGDVVIDGSVRGRLDRLGTALTH